MQLLDSCSSSSVMSMLLNPCCKCAGLKRAHIILQCPRRQHVACSRAPDTTECGPEHNSMPLGTRAVFQIAIGRFLKASGQLGS